MKNLYWSSTAEMIKDGSNAYRATKSGWQPPRYYVVFGCLYAVALGVGLLWPFDSIRELCGRPGYPRWIQGANGLEIKPRASVRSIGVPTRLHAAMVSGTGLTVEVWARANSLSQYGPARIVSYSKDKALRNFTLGQEGASLVMRLRTTGTDLNGRNPDLTLENVFRTQAAVHIAVTYDFSVERVFVDGRKLHELPGPGGEFANWDPSYSVILGNEATGNRPWHGTLFLVATYNRALSEAEVASNYNAGKAVGSPNGGMKGRVEDGLVALFTFVEGQGGKVYDRSGNVPPMELEMLQATPAMWQSFFSPPYANYHFTISSLADLLGNIAIFLPMGLLFIKGMDQTSTTRTRRVAKVVMIGLFLSACIEVVQYFSIVRVASLTDVMNNTVGTLAGIVLGEAQWLRKDHTLGIAEKGCPSEHSS